MSEANDARSGGFRQPAAQSSNTHLLRAAQRLAPPNMIVTLCDGLGALPPFNPDADTDAPPVSVLRWREQLIAADGILISTPEYAHGVPGALKNALDWLVGSGEFVGKPTALLQASPRGTYAVASLTETLSVMMARLVPEASIAMPLLAGPLDEAVVLSTPALSSALRAALAAFARALSAKWGDTGRV